MNLTFKAWVVYANGNPYSWQLSRAAAYLERKKRKDEHPHARWTVEKHEANLVVAARKETDDNSNASEGVAPSPPATSRSK